MTYEDEIAAEENNIAELREVSNRISMPIRNINWQFQNARFGNRNAAQARVITRAAKQRISNQIKTSQNKIVSLREALFGDGG